jgi:malonate transporter and related proteins
VFASLGDPILPIFAVLAAGYVFQKLGLMDTSHAAAINRFVFYIAAPALGVSVIGRADPGAIDWPPVAVYFAAQLAVYLAVFLLMRFAFRREPGEALLLGMTAVFANHIFFVLPISERFYGDAAARGMSGILLLDIAVIFCGSALIAEILTSENRSVGRTLAMLARNPFVYAPPVGVLLGLLGPLTPSGVWTFLTFTSAAAAPIVLFSLGITLAASPIFPIRLPCWSVAAAKLAAMPVLVWSGLNVIDGGMDGPARAITLLVAAGPCGAMPYVIATQYGIRTVTIAKTILISTVFSLVSLAVLLP